MTIKNPSKAGTLESSDIMIQLSPNEKEKGIEIDLKSAVEFQFGDAIRKTLEETCKELGIQHVKISAEDRGALDLTIKARLETAVKRGL